MMSRKRHIRATPSESHLVQEFLNITLYSYIVVVQHFAEAFLLLISYFFDMVSE